LNASGPKEVDARGSLFGKTTDRWVFPPLNKAALGK